jgi:hypothetical protein
MQLMNVAASLSNLVELQFGFNRLRELSPSTPAGSGEDEYARQRDTVLPKLERLNLEGNELQDWPDLVEGLARLPRCAAQFSASPPPSVWDGIDETAHAALASSSFPAIASPLSHPLPP